MDFKPPVKPPYFVLSVSPGTVPDQPFLLDLGAKDRLRQVPPALGAFAKYYKAKLDQPRMFGADVYLRISAEEDLFRLAQQMISDLTSATASIKANAQRQPPLPLKEIVAQKELVALLRWMATALEKSNLIPLIHTGAELIPIACPAVAEFVEPAKRKPPKMLRAALEGICKPIDGATVCVLRNHVWLELPVDLFKIDWRELSQRVLERALLYVGPAAVVAKGVLRALPGGELKDDGEASDGGHQLGMYPDDGK